MKHTDPNNRVPERHDSHTASTTSDSLPGGGPSESVPPQAPVNSPIEDLALPPTLAGMVESGSPIPAAAGFDLRSLALPQNFGALSQVRSEILTVPLRRPNKQTWFAVHPDSTTWMTAAVLKDELEDDNYIVAPALFGELEGEWAAKVLVPCITRQGSYYVWPIRLPDSGGRIDGWNRSALEIARSCGGQWIRVTSNREVGSYDVTHSVSPTDPPVWPADTGRLLETAVRGRVIDSLNHPMIKRLRGTD